MDICIQIHTPIISEGWPLRAGSVLGAQWARERFFPIPLRHLPRTTVARQGKLAARIGQLLLSAPLAVALLLELA